MNSNHQRQLQWYGTLKIIGGLLVLAPLPSLWGSSGALGNVLVLLASIAAFAVILRGWLALSVASRDKSGRWPRWGLFAALPVLVGLGGAAVVAVLLGCVVYWAGQQFEATILGSGLLEGAWRDVVAKAGYLIFGSVVLWRVPLIFRTVVAQAKSHSAPTLD